MKKKNNRNPHSKERLVKFTNLFYKEVYCTKDGIKTVLRYHMTKFNIPRLPSCSLHSSRATKLPPSPSLPPFPPKTNLRPHLAKTQPPPQVLPLPDFHLSVKKKKKKHYRNIDSVNVTYFSGQHLKYLQSLTSKPERIDPPHFSAALMKMHSAVILFLMGKCVFFQSN